MKYKQYSLYYKLYLLLEKCLITKQLLYNLRDRFELLCPAKETYIVKKTIQTILFTWGMIFFVMAGIISLRPSLVQFLIASVIAVILHKELISFSLRSLEEKILVQLEKFVSDIRHYYYVSHMVDEAIYDSLEHTSYELRVHALRFYDIITSEHCEELAEQYYASSKNNFLNLFLALCITVVEYGDRTIHQQSLFLLNLSNLKTEINIEILKIKQQNYLYAGLSFVIVAPMTVLKVIEHWGCSNLPELAVFYQSELGHVTAFAIIFTSLFIYGIVSKLRKNQRSQHVEHVIVDGILKNGPIQLILNNYKKTARKSILKLLVLIERSGDVLQVEQLLVQKVLCCLISFIAVVIISICYTIKNSNRYDWYELLMAVCIAVFFYFVPDLNLIFHQKLIQLGREDEIIRYQSIILILMYIERISVLEILERIEEFSYIFRKQLQNAINDYNASDLEALEQLKCSTNFLPFQRLVDNLIISDEIGIELAFDEIAAERIQFQEKRKQENEMNLNKRFSIAQFIAYIPAIIVIGGYLILPFLLECYRQLNEYRQIMNQCM